jgi:hypothetical protein
MAYFICNPLSYNRGKSLKYLVQGTVLVWTIHLPIMICHYFTLFPEHTKHILERLNLSDLFENVIKADIFPYQRSEVAFYHSCERYWLSGSAEETLIVVIFFILNSTAVGLTIAAFVAIARKLSATRRVGHGIGNERNQSRNRRQDQKLAKRGILITVFTLLPWLPNLCISMFAALATRINLHWYSHFYRSNKPVMIVLEDISIFLYHSVPWIYPLLNIVVEGNIRKALTGKK